MSEPLWHACPPDPDCRYCRGLGGGADWSFLDAVYCISLQERPDRAAGAAAELHRVGLCRLATFLRPARHPRKGIVGCWESHRLVGMRALEEGQQRVLILEDDVRFDAGIDAATTTRIRAALATLPGDWQIFFLGHWPLRAWFVAPGVLRTRSGCAHAYIASPRLLRWLRDHPWSKRGAATNPLVGRGIDAAYACLSATYALYPMIAVQAAGRSDNSTAAQKRARKNKARWRHLVTHSRHREWLLARLMRPAEHAVAWLSPLFRLLEERQVRRHLTLVSRGPRT
ncbi:MAG: hypothetical protein U1E14_04985 [Geminicoccaceae bacterium]